MELVTLCGAGGVYGGPVTDPLATTAVLKVKALVQQHF